MRPVYVKLTRHRTNRSGSVSATPIEVWYGYLLDPGLLRHPRKSRPASHTDAQNIGFVDPDESSPVSYPKMKTIY